jgi:hypothetical protein
MVVTTATPREPKKMDELKKRFERLTRLGKWFVKIVPEPRAALG